MARTADQLRREIAMLQGLRFEAKSTEMKKLAHARIEFLRGELKLQVAKEAGRFIAEPTEQERYECEEGAKQ